MRDGIQFDARLLYLYSDTPAYVRADRTLRSFRTMFREVHFLGIKRQNTWEGPWAEGVVYHLSDGSLSHGLHSLVALPKLIRYFRKQLDQIRPDVVVVVNDDFATLFATGLLPRPPLLVLDQYDSMAMRMRGARRILNPALRAVSNWTLPKMDALVEVSDIRLAMRRHLPAQTTVVHNAPHIPKNVTPARSGSPYLLLYGTIAEEIQPVRRLLEAVSTVAEAHILACGKIVGERTHSHLLNHPKVTWLGALPASRSLELVAGASAVFCHQNPSIEVYRYGSPNRLFEAMAFGVPVLINSENHACQLAREAGIALVDDYGDVQGIHHSLIRLFSGEWKPSENGDTARRLFRERYNARHGELRWVDLFKRLGVRWETVKGEKQ